MPAVNASLFNADVTGPVVVSVAVNMNDGTGLSDTIVYICVYMYIHT